METNHPPLEATEIECFHCGKTISKWGIARFSTDDDFWAWCADGEPVGTADICGYDPNTEEPFDHVPDRRPFYVNVWLVQELPGGYEEGGWWFNSGEPVASWPCQTRDTSRLAMECARERFPRGEYLIRVQREYAKPYPDQRPTYE